MPNANRALNVLMAFQEFGGRSLGLLHAFDSIEDSRMLIVENVLRQVAGELERMPQTHFVLEQEAKVLAEKIKKHLDRTY